MKKLIVPIVVPVMVLLFVGYVWAGVPNPAAVYCNDTMKFDSEKVEGPDGAQHSVCVLPDGTTCDAWEFLEGLCGKDFSYCAQQGYDLVVKNDGQDPFSNPYAACVVEGREVPVTALLGYLEKLNVGMWPQAPIPGPSGPTIASLLALSDPPPPASFDWRNFSGFNWMTSVKDQSQCGSCWFFSAVGTVEAVYNIRQNNPNLDLNLSEEYGVANCNGNNDGGCCGGFNDHALAAIRDNGTPDEACLPYNVATYNTSICSCYPNPPCAAGCPNGGGTNSCSLSPCSNACADVSTRLVRIQDYHDAGANDVNTMKQNLVAHGPLSVCLNFGGTFDTSVNAPFGVYKCSNTNTTHCIVIVGYDDAIGAWIAKNSWGDTWGPHGNGYLEVGYGQCGIESVPFWAEAADIGFPVVTIGGNVTFADTCVGSASYQTLNVCNTGTADLNVNSIVASDPQFSVTLPSTGYPVSISPDFCFPFQVGFTPTSVGQKTATLTIQSNDFVRPSVNVDATGNVPQPAIATLIANSGNFGDVCVGSFSDLNLTISNSGGCGLSVTNIASSSPDFKTASTLSFPLNIAAGGSIQVPIRFQPTTDGAKTANITISSNDPAAPSKVVAVSGNAPSPVATTSGALDFGQLCSGDSGTQTVQLCDTGKCDLTVTGATLAGPNCADFTLISPSPSSLPLTVSPDSCFGFVVSFTPTSLSPPNCSLVISTSDPANPTITFPVTAAVGAPHIVLDPAALSGMYAFPPTVVDADGSLGCHSDKTLVIRNNGTCPLKISGITATAPFKVIAPTQFPVILPPGQETLNVAVRFAPTTDGESPSVPNETTGTLTVMSNDPGGTASEPLCGEAVVQSGVRVLVVNGSDTPIAGLDNLTLTSKGVHTPSPISIRLKNVSPATATVCANTIQYHLDSENLPPAQTTGSNPNSSYNISAKEGNKQVSQSFTLGQCEFKEFILKLQ